MGAAFDRHALPTLRGLAANLGLYSEFPSVVITATDASGAALPSDGRAHSAVTFMFALSGKSFDFAEADVTHTDCLRPRFLGMKTTFYLQCAHAPGQTVAVSVAADVFTVTGRKGGNTPSDRFVLTMV